MDMVRLIYVSRMTETCDMEALQEILKVSRKNNVSEGITGLLCYDPSFFLQCLEGSKVVVNNLYSSILKDDRHQDVALLAYTNIQDRAFGDWAMGFLKTSDLDKDTLKSYTGTERFDPYLLSGERVLTFLTTIVAQERKRLESQ